MKAGWFIICILAVAGAQIRFTEVMYDLDGSDSPNEFVELFNLSLSDTLDLTGWQIRDQFTTDDLLDSGYGLRIPPQAYGIIFEGDYHFPSGIYADFIPEGTILIKVDDASIGNGLSTNDSLYLQDSAGVVVDAMGWTDQASNGYSLEKVRISLPNTPANWLPSLDSLGTPGIVNSVEPYNVDGALVFDSLDITPDILEINGTATISGFVTNSGLTTLSGDVEIIADNNVLESIYINDLVELDTVGFSMIVGPFASGAQALVIHFMVVGDEYTENNEAILNCAIRYPVGLLTINEFLPYPESGAPEFVELIYHGNELLSLQNWGIADEIGNPALLGQVIITDQTYIIVSTDSTLYDQSPDTSLFLTAMDGLPILNNNGDAIRIFDPYHTLIDSLTYNNNWGYNRGQSMEKIHINLPSADSANWRPATDPSGSTPGRRNSVSPWPIDGSVHGAGIVLQPVVPSETDQIKLTIPVINLGQQALTGYIYIELGDTELASTTVDIPNSGDTTTVLLTISPLPPGRHDILIMLDIIGDGNTLNNTKIVVIKVRYPFGTVQLNEFMARPNNDQIEFIEAVSFDNLTMSAWGISDNNLQLKNFPEINISASDYIVFAMDSSLYPLNNPQAHYIVPLNGWPILNNSGDGIYLYDLTGSIIDSLYYTNIWPITDERSTEKLRPEFDSFSARNWALATDTARATPGWSNSVALFDLDGAIVADATRHEPLYPDQDEPVTAYLMVTNSGVTAITGDIKLNIDGDFYGSSEITELMPGDTVILTLEFGPLLSGYHETVFELIIPGDENSTNNTAADSVWVSYPFGSVMINEFMVIPDSGQTEFIELVPQEKLLIKHWAISDDTRGKRRVSWGAVTAGSYLVAAADSAITDHIEDTSYWTIPQSGFPNLNNTADGIYVYDMTSKVIDSLIYTKSWNILPQRSQEKYRPDFESADSARWSNAVHVDGQTPGRENSVYYAELPATGSWALTPNPFSPDGDGFDDLLYIKYKLPFPTSLISIQIFDIIGREIATPYWNTYTAQENILTWDGKMSNGKPARIGMYIIKLKAVDIAGQRTWEQVDRVVLAKKL